MNITDFEPIEASENDDNLPIVFFHKFDEKGKIIYQGFVTSINYLYGGQVIFYDWMFGDERSVANVTVEFFNKCQFYTSDYEMREGYKLHKSTYNCNEG